MTTLYLPTQEGGPATCGEMVACSGLTLPTFPLSWLMRANPGAPADGTITVNGNTITRAAILVQSGPGEPGVATWKAGTWRMRVHSLAGFPMTWDTLHVCRVNLACATVTTIASATALGIFIANSELVYEADAIAGADHTGDPSDSIYIVCGLFKGGPGAQAHDFRFDQVVDTPIELPEPVPGPFGPAAAGSFARAQAAPAAAAWLEAHNALALAFAASEPLPTAAAIVGARAQGGAPGAPCEAAPAAAAPEAGAPGAPGAAAPAAAEPEAAPATQSGQAAPVEPSAEGA